LMTLAPVKSLREFRRTPVRFELALFQFPNSRCRFTDLVQQGMSEKVAISVSFLSSFFTGFVVAYVRSWRLALAISSILPCIGITGAIMNRFVSRYMQTSRDHVAKGGTVAEEVFSTIRTAQAFGTQERLSGLYDSNVEEAHRVDIKAAFIHGISLSCFFFVIYSAYGLAFSFGTTLLLQGHATVGIIVNVFIAILIGSFSLAMLAPEMQAISHGRAAASKLFATIDRVPTIDSSDPSGLKPEHVVGEIKLEGVDFSYPSRPNVPIVRDLSITFPAGKTAALVGASGSGKSTIVCLVERFYDPLKGRLSLDGVDLRDLNLKWLRTQIGLVSQEPVLFATTIQGNVEQGLIGTPWEHASPDEKFKLVKEACVKANADGFITKLPLGYDTLVGERGFLLSGGQKQRVAIARAIVSDPPILLLDEATSALDTQSEGIVQDALDKAAAGRTTITIAHRLSTIKNASCIYVMGKGVVLEQGTHDDLLANPDSAYARLVAAQKLREANERREGDDDDVSGSASSDDLVAQEKAEAQRDADEKEATRRELEREALAEIPLGRKNTGRSLASELIEQQNKSKEEKYAETDYSLYYLFKRMGGLQGEVWKSYLFGSVFATLTGIVYPAFGIVYAKAVTTFQSTDHATLRHSGDRNALWFFIIAILSAMTIGVQNYTFGAAAANLTHKLRSLSFKAVLRQDSKWSFLGGGRAMSDDVFLFSVEFFDKDENSVCRRLCSSLMFSMLTDCYRRAVSRLLSVIILRR